LFVSRCCLLPFFFFLINQIYKNFAIEVLPLPSAVGRDGLAGSLRFFGGKTPVRKEKRNVPDCAGMEAQGTLHLFYHLSKNMK
jgi:hypothetical protein